MQLQTAASSDPTVRNGRAHQAACLEMIEGERPGESSSLTSSVSVATGSVELYIGGRSEGPRTKPSQIPNGG